MQAGTDGMACRDQVHASEEAQRGRSSWAEVDWRTALEDATRKHDTTCFVQMQSVAGVEALYLFDYAQALDRFNKARFVAARVGDSEARIDAELDLATTLLFLGRYEDAVSAVEVALPRLENRERTRYAVWRRAAALRVLGRAQISLGQMVDGIESLGRALEQSRLEADRWPPASGPGSILALPLQTLGRAYLDAGRLEEARRHLGQAAEIEGAPPNTRALSLLNLAELEVLEVRPQAAQHFLASARDHFDGPGVAVTLPEFHFDYVDALVRESLRDIPGALAAARAVVARLEAARSMSATELTAPFFHKRRFYADLLVRLLVRDGRVEEAFEVAEGMRARGLLDSILWPTARLRDQASPADVQRADRLREQLAQLTRGQEDVAKILATRDALVRLESEIRRAAGAMAAEPIRFESVRELLAPGELLLSFSPAENGILLWVLEGGEGALRVETLPPADRLVPTIHRVLEALGQGRSRSRGVERELASLSRALLGPVERELGRSRHVLIAAEGVLGSVPFAALPQPDGRPLLRSHSVSQIFSLSVLAALRARDRGPGSTDTTQFTAVVEPTYRSSSAGARPPLQSRDLVTREFAHLVGSSGLELRVLRGTEASRKNVLADGLATSRFVHFSAHVELHRSVPDLSAIRLAETGPEGRVDGALRLRDLAGLKLQAEVVTLAGCQSASELRRGAEGPMAFPRGILHAGATSVIASLWPVRDQPTSALMVKFYELLLEGGLGPAEALRRAQIHLLDGDWPAPQHWAGFVLLGDWRTREDSSDEPIESFRVYLDETGDRDTVVSGR